MKKNIKIIIIVFTLVVLGYFGYKGYNLYIYKDTDAYKELIKNFKVSQELNISHKEVADNNYLVFKNLKIRDDFKDYVILDEGEDPYGEYIKYAKYDESNNLIASIWLGKQKPLVELLKSEMTTYASEKNYSNVTAKEYLEKNEITNDIDLYRSIIKNKNINNNIFTSVKDMKQRDIFNNVMSIITPTTDKGIVFIKGDYTGYILQYSGNIVEANILVSGDRYSLTFVKSDYFDMEYIYDIISSVVIE